MDVSPSLLAAAALALWFGFRYFRLKRGVAALARSLLVAPGEEPAPLPDGPGRPLALLRRAIVDTVGEATLARDSERQQREFLEALLNEIKDAIFILDCNREIRFANAAARLLFPSDQPYRARALYDVCHDHRVYDTLDLAEEIGAKVSDHIALRVREGNKERLRELILLVEAEPLSFGQGGAPAGSWILMKDITAQLETEQIRQDFVANASHELRTPLSIINGYLETLDEEEAAPDGDAQRRAIRTMRKHGERIARIVEDMLTISKLEGTDGFLSNEPFDLHQSVEDIVGQLQPIVEAHRARIRVEASPEISWTLVGDRFYWDQIFFNLIENALKQNPEPGLKITVRFALVEGRYRISVSDDGIGIPAADLPLVFKRFYRVQKHHAQSQVKGTGLGLSIVKRAVEAHRGHIEVESRPGVETVFTITVPQSTANAPDGPAERSGTEGRNPGDAR